MSTNGTPGRFPVDSRPDTEQTDETEAEPEEPFFVTVGYRRRSARLEEVQRSLGGEGEEQAEQEPERRSNYENGAAESPERFVETPTAIVDDQAEAEVPQQQLESPGEPPEAPLSTRQGHIFWLDIDPEDAFPREALPPPPPDCPLHRAVFENDVKTVAKLLESGRVLVAQKDIHGKTRYKSWWTILF